VSNITFTQEASATAAPGKTADRQNAAANRTLSDFKILPSFLPSFRHPTFDCM
jgi:hypothetical protein